MSSNPRDFDEIAWVDGRTSKPKAVRVKMSLASHEAQVVEVGCLVLGKKNVLVRGLAS